MSTIIKNQTIKLPLQKVTNQISTTNYVKYNALKSLIFKVTDRSRGKDNSKITEGLPCKCFCIYIKYVTTGYSITITRSHNKTHCENLGSCRFPAPSLVQLFPGGGQTDFPCSRQVFFSRSRSEAKILLLKHLYWINRMSAK